MMLLVAQSENLDLKPVFHLVTLFARTDKKVGTFPTCSRRIEFNQSMDSCFCLASQQSRQVENGLKTAAKERKPSSMSFTSDFTILVNC